VGKLPSTERDEDCDDRDSNLLPLLHPNFPLGSPVRGSATPASLLALHAERC
jgi:hypothetical protein